MPLPTAYDEAGLIAFMEDELGAVGTDLVLTGADQLRESVYEVIGLLGHDLSEENDITGVMKVRSLARWQAWLAARKAAARQFDTTLSGGKNFKLSQVWEQINTELAAAATAASVYPEGASAAAGSTINVVYFRDVDPYTWPTFGTEFG